MSSAQPAAPDRGSPRSAIANAVVRLHAEHYGRGPTRARAHLGDDHVLVVLEDVLTVAERTLVRHGHGDKVKAARESFNDALRGEFVAAVEGIIGRRVRACLCQLHLEPEVAMELFMLEPAA
ncbi:MAG: DUF2294 domain-containing protein [Solirubrobacterales bacterium]|nr:DUF2294 domain-containing protein [Solirubrobacterales bacterium]